MSNWSLTYSATTKNIHVPTEWDDNQPPRLRQIDTQGRSWSRVHYEGAGPFRITVTGVLEGTVSETTDIVRTLKTWMKDGSIVTLNTNGDETDYDGTNYLIENVDAPRTIGNLTHRWITLTLVRRDED